METGRSTARVASFSRHRGEQGGLGYPPGAWKAKPSGPAAPPEAARKGASHKRGGIGDAAAAAMGARGPAVGTNAVRALTSASHRPRLCSAGLARPRCDGRPATERRAGAGAGAQGPCPLARRRLTQFPFALSQTCPRAHAHRRPPNPHPRVPPYLGLAQQAARGPPENGGGRGRVQGGRRPGSLGRGRGRGSSSLALLSADDHGRAAGRRPGGGGGRQGGLGREGKGHGCVEWVRVARGVAGRERGRRDLRLCERACNLPFFSPFFSPPIITRLERDGGRWKSAPAAQAGPPPAQTLDARPSPRRPPSGKAASPGDLSSKKKKRKKNSLCGRALCALLSLSLSSPTANTPGGVQNDEGLVTSKSPWQHTHTHARALSPLNPPPPPPFHIPPPCLPRSP